MSWTATRRRRQRCGVGGGGRMAREYLCRCVGRGERWTSFSPAFLSEDARRWEWATLEGSYPRDVVARLPTDAGARAAASGVEVWEGDVRGGGGGSGSPGARGYLCRGGGFPSKFGSLTRGARPCWHQIFWVLHGHGLGLFAPSKWQAVSRSHGTCIDAVARPFRCQSRDWRA